MRRRMRALAGTSPCSAPAGRHQRIPRARRVLQDMFIRSRNEGVTGDPLYIIPFRKADRLQLVLDIVIVIIGDVGIDSAEAEPVEQMRLPEIADVVINAAAFAPARHRRDIARQHREQAQAAEKPEEFHPVHIEPRPVSPLLGAAGARSNRAGIIAKSLWAWPHQAPPRSAAAYPWLSPLAAHLPHRTRTRRSRGWAPAGGPAGTA